MRKKKNLAAANRRTLWWSLLVIVVMFGFGFAAAPLYDVICRALGISAKTGRVDEPVARAPVDLSRTVTVEFTGNAMAGLPWEFRPMVKKVDVHPGAITTVAYYVRNPSAEKMVGQAVPSVTPVISAAHFNKVECFCFSQQPLAPGETRQMPVRFIVDARLPREVRTITLSYAFFNTDGAQARRFGGEPMSSSSGATHVHTHASVH